MLTPTQNKTFTDVHSLGGFRDARNQRKLARKSARETAQHDRRAHDIVDRFQNFGDTLSRENGRPTDKAAGDSSKVLLHRYSPLTRIPGLSFAGSVAKCVLAACQAGPTHTDAVGHFDEQGTLKSFEAEQTHHESTLWRFTAGGQNSTESLKFETGEDGSKSYQLEKFGVKETVVQDARGNLTYTSTH